MFNILQKDFDKLPQNVRYIFISGFLFIFNAWLLDHWKSNQELPYYFMGIVDLRSISYNVGTCLFFVALILVVFKQIVSIPGIIFWNKSKYDIKDLGKKFELVWFKGKLMLFQHRDKRYFHVLPWETAQDLNFVSYGTHVNDDFPNPINTVIILDDGRKLDTSKYKNGGEINTRK
jgi:hypothetical protein